MTTKPTDAAALMLGITKPQIASMQKRIDTLERENDAIALTRVRHEISRRLVEIRLLLRDGNLKGLNGGRTTHVGGFSSPELAASAREALL